MFYELILDTDPDHYLDPPSILPFRKEKVKAATQEGVEQRISVTNGGCADKTGNFCCV